MFTFHASFKQAELFRMTMGVHQHMFIDLPANKINYDAMFAHQAKAKRGARALRTPRGPSSRKKHILKLAPQLSNATLNSKITSNK